MFYIGNHKDRIVSFTIRKEIECRTSSIAENQFNSLAELQEKKDTFGEICIPNFRYGKNNNFVWYESDYIKGRIIEREDMKLIVWKECILRQDSFTLSNYDRTNYIKCSESSKIYFIDLNDCRHMTIEERMASWKKAGY